MVQRVFYDKILNIDKAVYFCDNNVFCIGCKSLALFRRQSALFC